MTFAKLGVRVAKYDKMSYFASNLSSESVQLTETGLEALPELLLVNNTP
jgi:hypothetical protein